MTMLADHVEVVIGVDTHKHTHTAAVVMSATGASVEELTVPTDPDGYLALLDLAAVHPGLRAWAIEGTGGYGAGLNVVSESSNSIDRNDPIVEAEPSPIPSMPCEPLVTPSVGTTRPSPGPVVNGLHSAICWLHGDRQ